MNPSASSVTPSSAGAKPAAVCSRPSAGPGDNIVTVIHPTGHALPAAGAPGPRSPLFVRVTYRPA